MTQSSPEPYQFKLIVFNIEKAENIGLLMRTAYAFGCDELLVVGRKRFKVTGASHSHRLLPWQHFYHLEEAVAHCRQAGCRIYGVEIGGAWLTETRFDHHAAFILGNEGKGICDAANHCDQFIAIPQWRGMPSLNVAVAGALVMFEYQKQQGIAFAEVEGQRFYDTNYRLE